MSYEVYIEARHHPRHLDDNEEKLSTALKLAGPTGATPIEKQKLAAVAYALRAWADELDPAAEISSDDLHRAADIVGSFGDDESLIGAHGLPFEELQAFVDGSDSGDIGPGGPERNMDPLALAIGISIGVVVANAPWRSPSPARS